MDFSIHMVNTATGKRFKSDAGQSRLARMRRRVVAWSKVAEELQFDGQRMRRVMITLTYKGEGKWQPNHMRDFVKRFKEVLGSGLYALAWCAEMQERGAVHYHLYALVRPRTKIPMPDKSGMWPHGSTQIATGRSFYYLVSYLKKEYQKAGFPKGCRIFAVYLRKSLLRPWTYTKFRWSALPNWLNEELNDYGVILVALFARRKEGGGWYLDVPEDRQHFFEWPVSKLEFYSPWVMI